MTHTETKQIIILLLTRRKIQVTTGKQSTWGLKIVHQYKSCASRCALPAIPSSVRLSESLRGAAGHAMLTFYISRAKKQKTGLHLVRVSLLLHRERLGHYKQSRIY